MSVYEAETHQDAVEGHVQTFVEVPFGVCNIWILYLVYVIWFCVCGMQLDTAQVERLAVDEVLKCTPNDGVPASE